MKRSLDRFFEHEKFSQTPMNPTKAKLGRSIDIKVEVFMGRTVYTLQAKSAKTGVCVFYLHGGAYIYGIDPLHFAFIERLIKKTGCTVILPDYPLAPDRTAKDVYVMIEALYNELLKDTDVDRLMLMGDSAGGGIALGLAQVLKQRRLKQPDQIILLSPWLDVSMENPEIASVVKNEVILSISGLKLAAQAYAGDLDLKDPRISPIYGQMAGLAPISIFTSTNDVLNPDARKLKKLLDEKGIAIRYEEFAGLFHDWMLFTLKESQTLICELKAMFEMGSERDNQ